MSVVVEDRNGKTQMITKGAVEENAEYFGFCRICRACMPLTASMKKLVMEKWMRLMPMALESHCRSAENQSADRAFSIADENEMVLIGYLAF